MNIFTTISQLKYTHEDICILESDGSTIKSLNCSVLELAPCSVGIVVDRGHFGRSMISSDSSYSVAMIFLGGNDDREARH